MQVLAQDAVILRKGIHQLSANFLRIRPLGSSVFPAKLEIPLMVQILAQDIKPRQKSPCDTGCTFLIPVPGKGMTDDIFQSAVNI